MPSCPSASSSSSFLFHGRGLLWQKLYGWIRLCVLTNAAFRSAFGFGASCRVRYTVEISEGSAQSAWGGSSGAIEEVHLLRSGSRKALPLLIFLIRIFCVSQSFTRTTDGLFDTPLVNGVTLIS